MTDFVGSSSHLVGILGYLMLKWGNPSDLHDYQGGRLFEDLRQFADKDLKTQCSIMNLDMYDNDKGAQIKRY
ncbi:hypothetical protein ACHAXA_009555 [Cyclostephanos tholiformis]|uniref:Uncharacterized protein n=1 Tax=Cyclostephanos tholiformis TaxID=382380 RepID=A0ABD3SEF0_9STRA